MFFFSFFFYWNKTLKQSLAKLFYSSIKDCICYEISLSTLHECVCVTIKYQTRIVIRHIDNVTSKWLHDKGSLRGRASSLAPANTIQQENTLSHCGYTTVSDKQSTFFVRFMNVWRRTTDKWAFPTLTRHGRSTILITQDDPTTFHRIYIYILYSCTPILHRHGINDISWSTLQ